ncbi:MAG TPA: DNA polymerase, partial [Polyangiaceae bacterium]|nr:DNA polymerase [Polyangiaceae bacterium]
GAWVRSWLMGEPASEPPFEVGDNVLVIAYYASAEVGCILSLGWPVPTNVVDLFAEFRVATNGRALPGQTGLLAALRFFGVDHAVNDETKDAMRQLAMRGGAYDHDERATLLAYCETDIEALRALLPEMERNLDIDRALLRGRYMVAAARMEHVGVPIDAPALAVLRDRWTDVRDRLGYLASLRYPGVFDGARFVERGFVRYLERRRLEWPRLPSGRLKLDDDTFKDMVRSRPDLRLLHEARRTLARLRAVDLPVGTDRRARTILGAFSAKTGRNQPSNSRFIFGMPAWLRSLIRPAPGMSIAYVDWSQQEFGIAGALSGDEAMKAAYVSGDPYMAFAILAGAAPPGATKATHEAVREIYKVVVIATQYMMGAASLATQLGVAEAYAADLLRQHRKAFRRYWAWSDDVAASARLRGRMQTAFGWSIVVGLLDDRERSIRNWPIQSTGAEMLRIACVLAIERGVRVCAPVHDALLIEAPSAEIEGAVATTQAAMREASGIVLDGFSLRADAKVFAHPERYVDPRGAETWARVFSMLGVQP